MLVQNAAIKPTPEMLASGSVKGDPADVDVFLLMQDTFDMGQLSAEARRDILIANGEPAAWKKPLRASQPSR